MKYAVEIQGLKKEYAAFRGFGEFFKNPFQRKKTLAIKDINLRIRQGEIFGLLGPNGAGKTTLIKVLCTLLLPDAGSVLVNGFDVLKEEKKVQRSIGLVNTSERSFFSRLSGKENLEFFGKLFDLDDSVLKERIPKIFKLLNLENAMNKKYFAYSSGMKQKLCIGRGLLNDPKLLLLDEPTLGLDPKISTKLHLFIKETIQKKLKKTVLLATHDLSEAKILCDRISIIQKGKIKTIKNAAEFKNTKALEKFYIKMVGD